MPISFVCPHCRIETQVADRYVGQTGPCASCGKTITVPAADRVPDAPNRSAESKNGPGILFILGIIGGAMFVMLVVVGIIAALLLPAINSAQMAAGDVRCASHLSQIGVAMHQYAAQYGTFPPAYVTDEQGNPMHSWRVLLLPYLGTEGRLLYEQYDMAEPWDSDFNSQFVGSMPSVYGCPADAGTGFGETSYLVITGPEFLFDADEGKGVDQIADGASNTLMVVEVSESSVNWLEPNDLDGSRLTFQVDTAGNDEIGSFHQGGANVLMADGSIRTLDSGTPAAAVRAMATIDAGDETDAYGTPGF